VPLVGLTAGVRSVSRRAGVELPVAIAPLKRNAQGGTRTRLRVTYRRLARSGDVVAAVASIHSSGRALGSRGAKVPELIVSQSPASSALQRKGAGIDPRPQKSAVRRSAPVQNPDLLSRTDRFDRPRAQRVPGWQGEGEQGDERCYADDR
jgi:hypothetical protein